MNTLVSKDNKGKIRVVEIDYEWVDARKGYVIKRNTFQYGGKVSVQPEIWIFSGKAKRTVTEQVKLEYNSHLKKYLDKGYKALPTHININQSDKVKEFVDAEMSDGVSDSNGFKKHMLAKQADKVATSVFDKLKYWYASRKIDGVRCSFYIKDDEIVSASRGGKHYDFATQHIRLHPKMVELFKKMPNLVLDGELYLHGKSLQQISGAARQEKDEERAQWLEYYIYDIMDNTLTCEERIEVLHDISLELELGEFHPDTTFGEDDLRVRMVPQEKVTGWNNIQKIHDKYVSEGFEGVVIRDPSKLYSFGGRGNAMIKVKMYQDAEFKIVGYSDGLRPEDMVFVCETDLGVTFEAKPIGPRELKYEYLDRMDEIIGKMATIKFFNYSDEGKPTQTNLKCIRDYE